MNGRVAHHVNCIPSTRRRRSLGQEFYGWTWTRYYRYRGPPVGRVGTAYSELASYSPARDNVRMHGWMASHASQTATATAQRPIELARPATNLLTYEPTSCVSTCIFMCPHQSKHARRLAVPPKVICSRPFDSPLGTS